MSLDRYRDIIPDWEAFEEASHAPEPVTLRVRRGRASVGEVRSRLEKRGFRLSPVPGLPDYLRVEDGPGSVAQTPEHWLGLFHIQQAVMALPALALAPRPGERVLDLCAAPGGKTGHMAELMEERGPLVAVDPKEKRLRALLGTLYRLGNPNVLVVGADGRELPEDAPFDRVLVDAPCSAEGNYRRKGGRLPRRTPSFVSYVSDLQEALLRKATRLVRPGGVVVYSTCTFAPEENEEILARILETEPVEVERIALDVPHDIGLKSWSDRDLPEEMGRAWRVYPHHLDSGGMFMARLRRKGQDGEAADSGPRGDPGPGWTPVPEAFPGGDPRAAGERIESALAELEERYGVDRKLLEELGWMERGRNLWVHTAGSWPVDAWLEGGRKGWRVVSLGLRALRRTPAGRETPSNHFLVRYGDLFAADRRVVLDPDDLARLLAGERLPAEGLGAGPVVLVWEGRPLGRGMVGTGGLRHEIPRADAERLRTVLSGPADGLQRVRA